MDIRKYFSGGANKKSATEKPTRKGPKRVRKIIDSDDDEDPVPTKIRKRPSKLIDFDSDSDQELNSKPMKKGESPKKSSPVKKPAKKLKPVSVDDFFGSPVKQKASTSAKKKPEKAVKKREESHPDENFNETLKKNNEVVKMEKRKIEPSSVSATPTKKLKKETTAKDRNGNHRSLSSDKKPDKIASKLAAKIKDSTKSESSSVIKPARRSTPKKNTRSETPPKEDELPKKTELEEGTPNDPEKKKKSFLNYQKYLHREGPKAPGSKEIPEGGENCLEGLTFVITGILESLERDEAKSLVERYGGKVTTNVSKNTKYLLAGNEAGPSKLQKAENLRTPKIDEDGLFDLIRKLPGKKSKYEIEALKESNNKATRHEKVKVAKKTIEISSKDSGASKITGEPAHKPSETRMWVDRYRPTNLRQIVGQQGDNSNAKKLLKWLRDWHKNQTGSNKKKPNFAAKWKDTSGASFKAALLSGSPGVGKTTTAQLVCKEADFSFVEMNASDTRSKKNLEQHVASLISNTSVNNFFGKKTKHNSHALIMDEVDGMAGNEDRGGIQELIQLIKASKVPIICICNDKSLPKMRSLLNYCFDLAFQKPRVEQIKGAMMSIAFKEGLKIAPPALQEIILGANQDVRQVLHNLSMWSAKEKSISYDQAKFEAKRAQKNIHQGPFDVLRKVFSGGSDIKTLSNKSDLFFNDYSISPLFVQENYLQVNPRRAKSNKVQHLKLLSATADSLCDGDLVEKTIRSRNVWSLLPLQAMYSSVLPGEYLSGHLSAMITFPTWLGRNSSRGKIDRLAQELLQHTRLQVSANKTELLLDYCRLIKDSIVQPLIRKEADGVPEAIVAMESYSLSREDLDSLLEVNTWLKAPNPFSSLNPKVKSAFTRAYNKEAVKKPYSTSTNAKKTKSTTTLDEEGEEVEDVSEEEEGNIGNDAMIKASVSKSAPTSKSKAAPKSKSKASTTKASGKKSKKKT